MGYRPWPRLAGFRAHAGVRRILRLMLPAVIGVAAVQLNVFVNTRFAASLGDGPVAQLEYAFRIFFLPIGMFGVALATVTTTTVSEEAARGDHEGLIARAKARAESLGECAAPAVRVRRPKRFPVVIKPGKRAAFRLLVDVDCADDPGRTTARNPGHDDFVLRVTMTPSALDRFTRSEWTAPASPPAESEALLDVVIR